MSDMRVIEHGAGGAPDVMTISSRPVPQPEAGEILIKVAAAGVNGPDLKQRRVADPQIRLAGAGGRQRGPEVIGARGPQAVPDRP